MHTKRGSNSTGAGHIMGSSSFWRKYWQWLVIAGLFTGSLLFGYIGFIKYYAGRGETRSCIDILKLSHKQFFLESG